MSVEGLCRLELFRMVGSNGRSRPFATQMRGARAQYGLFQAGIPANSDSRPIVLNGSERHRESQRYIGGLSGANRHCAVEIRFPLGHCVGASKYIPTL
jgi:hypothetical protein